MNSNKTVTVTFVESGVTLIGEILQNPSWYEGKIVKLSGNYRGWETGHGSPPISRSDWVIQDFTGAIYVTGGSQNLTYPQDLGKPTKIAGTVRAKNEIPYIELPGTKR
jgi:hypothetical protein